MTQNDTHSLCEQLRRIRMPFPQFQHSKNAIKSPECGHRIKFTVSGASLEVQSTRNETGGSETSDGGDVRFWGGGAIHSIDRRNEKKRTDGAITLGGVGGVGYCMEVRGDTIFIWKRVGYSEREK